ncbi:MAG: hypothetical protein V1874_11165 [Spirochaetota bacterium]
MIFHNSSLLVKPAAFLCVVIIAASCSNARVKKNDNIQFAIINNTRGESPYSGLGPKVLPVLKQIKDENPVFLIHLGGIICGGENWYGVSKADVDRQYLEIFSIILKVLPNFYTVKSETELLNTSSEYYSKYSGKKDYYSFNCGNSHFIVLDSTQKTISDKQKEWLKNDLEETGNLQDIFVFISDPIFIPNQYKYLNLQICKGHELLHKHFAKHRVKAVFSGSGSVYFKSDIDGVSYINTGCGGFNKIDYNNGYCQYYVAEFKNGALRVYPKYSGIK